MRHRSVLLVAALAMASCTSASASFTPSGTTPPGMPLPAMSWWPPPTGVVAACGGVGMGPVLTLQGSPADGVYGLLNGTKRIPILWPPGYRVVFDPSMRVLDPTGKVAADVGDDLLAQYLSGGLLICTEGTQIEMMPL